MAKTPVGNKVSDSGWQSYGMGQLPPFVILAEGQSLEGFLKTVRLTERKKGNKVVSIQPKYTFELTKPLSKVNIGTVRKPVLGDFEKGALVTLSGHGGLDRQFRVAVLEADGFPIEDSSKINAEIDKRSENEYKYALILNRECRVTRGEDSLIKKGEWKGKMAHNYQMDMRLPVAA